MELTAKLFVIGLALCIGGLDSIAAIETRSGTFCSVSEGNHQKRTLAEVIDCSLTCLKEYCKSFTNKYGECYVSKHEGDIPESYWGGCTSDQGEIPETVLNNS